MMNCEKIKQMILEKLPDAIVNVESQDNVHFSAIVVSQHFATDNLVKRQRKVYACLGDHIHNGDIHAFTLKTYTDTEWTNLAGGTNHG